MKYGLDSNGTAVMLDRSPILSDVRNGFNIYFALPDTETYVAVFKSVSGLEYRVKIEGGVCKLPKELFRTEQYVEITVYKTNGDQILQAWKCEPIKLKNFNALRREQWEVSGGMTEKDALTRMSELTIAYWKFRERVSDFDESNKAALNALNLSLEQLTKELRETAEQATIERQTLKEQLKTATTEIEALKTYQGTITDTFNKLAARVYELEKNYDPTIIK